MRVALCRESNPQSKPSSFRFKTGLYVLWLFGVGGGDDPSVSSENSPRATHLCGITQTERALHRPYSRWGGEGMALAGKINPPSVFF